MNGACGRKTIENTKISSYFHGLGEVVKGAGGPRNIENTQISLYFHGLGGVVKGAGGPMIFEKHRFLCIFMVWAAC